jgi:hypothetical protein
MTKTSTIIGSIILGLFFTLPVFASNTLYFDTHIGYYCTQSGMTSTYLSGGHYAVNGTCNAYYIGNNLPAESSPYYGSIFQKTSGTTAVSLNGHQLGGSNSGTFSSSQNDSFVLGTTSKIYFIAIYSNTKCNTNHPDHTLINYLLDTQNNPLPDSGCDWGQLLFTDIPVWQGQWNYMLAPEATSTTDFGVIGNYFRDLFIWLFRPQQSSLEQFTTLQTTMESKAPFAYFVTIKNALSGLSGSSTPAFSLAGSTAVTNSFFNPLKIGLTWILWIVFAFWVIRKISNFNF